MKSIYPQAVQTNTFHSFLLWKNRQGKEKVRSVEICNIKFSLIFAYVIMDLHFRTLLTKLAVFNNDVWSNILIFFLIVLC